MKLRVRHTKLGKIRFTSHRDTARHWERAVRKAGVRVAYSAGFTPRPKLSFGLALPTGAESLAEYLDMELVDDDLPPIGEIGSLLNSALPPGYEVTGVALREPGSPSLQEDVVACTWQFALAGVDHDELRAAIDTALAAPALLVTRERKGQESTDDVRPAILELSTALVDDDPRPHLCAVLATTGRGLRPLELVAALFPEHDAVDVAARVLRTQQWIERDGRRQELLAADVDAPRAPAGCA